LVLGTLATAHYIIPPHDSLTINRSDDLLSLGIYFVVGLSVAVMSELLRIAQRRAEAAAGETARLNRLLQDADRRKDEFLAMLSHELRSPLSVVHNCLYQIERSDDPSVLEIQPVLERQVKHLVRLVDDLLDLSRIRHGKLEFRAERVDLVAAVRQAVEAARPQIESQGHRLSLEFPAGPIWLEGDPARLAQVTTNLLNNAARYSQQPGCIWLTVRREEQQAVISVRDTGIGISPEVLPVIFELFGQADHGSVRTGGLGIGLSLVRTLVELHQGNVVAYSAGTGQGSEFVVRLPVADPAARSVAARR
jgi:signal transduction histidine kinase